MKNMITTAAIVAISMSVIAGSAEAAGSKSSVEFQNMIEKIQAGQAARRAELLKVVVATKAAPSAKVQAMLKKVSKMQAKRRSEILTMVSAPEAMPKDDFYAMLDKVSKNKAERRAALLEKIGSFK